MRKPLSLIALLVNWCLRRWKSTDERWRVLTLTHPSIKIIAHNFNVKKWFFYSFILWSDRLQCSTGSGLSKTKVMAIEIFTQYYVRHQVGCTCWGMTEALNRELSEKGNIQQIIVSEKCRVIHRLMLIHSLTKIFVGLILNPSKFFPKYAEALNHGLGE